MKAIFTETYLPTNENELATFENEISQLLLKDGSISEPIVLPEDYKQFLLTVNGVELLPYLNYFAEGDIEFEGYFLGFHPGYKNIETNFNRHWMSLFLDAIDYYDGVVVPIAFMDNGASLTLKLTEPDYGTVGYSMEGELSIIAKNFTTFIESMDYGAQPYDVLAELKRCVHIGDCSKLVTLIKTQQFGVYDADHIFTVAIDLGCLEAIQTLHNMGVEKPYNWSLKKATTIPVAKFMLQQGLNINKEDPAGNTPLNMQAFHGRLPLVKYLISEGADFNFRNIQGKTALNIAKENLKELEEYEPVGYFQKKDNLKQVIEYLASLK